MGASRRVASVGERGVSSVLLPSLSDLEGSLLFAICLTLPKSCIVATRHVGNISFFSALCREGCRSYREGRNYNLALINPSIHPSIHPSSLSLCLNVVPPAVNNRQITRLSPERRTVSVRLGLFGLETSAAFRGQPTGRPTDRPLHFSPSRPRPGRKEEEGSNRRRRRPLSHVNYFADFVHRLASGGPRRPGGRATSWSDFADDHGGVRVRTREERGGGAA